MRYWRAIVPAYLFVQTKCLYHKYWNTTSKMFRMNWLPPWAAWSNNVADLNSNPWWDIFWEGKMERLGNRTQQSFTESLINHCQQLLTVRGLPKIVIGPQVSAPNRKTFQAFSLTCPLRTNLYDVTNISTEVVEWMQMFAAAEDKLWTETQTFFRSCNDFTPISRSLKWLE